MKGLFYCSFLFTLTFNSLSQVTIGGNSEDSKILMNKEKSTQDTIKLSSEKKETNSAIYSIANWSRTDRILKENSNYFGKELGNRANEKFLDTWSFGIGIQNEISKHWMWDGGMAFIRNGESYSYQGKDTSVSYKTTYSFISMPVRINYFIGRDIKFYSGVGIIPQMFLHYVQERGWTGLSNNSGSDKISTSSGFNSFVLSAVGNLGVMLNLGNNWSLLVSSEFRIQLNSTYSTQDSFIHKARAAGISFGLARNL